MTADPQGWQRLEELFEAALELPAEDRAAFLAEQCGPDRSLRTEIEEMLEAHEGDGGLAIESRLLEAPAEGRTVGQYRLLEPIGRGGMGEVFRAERADDHYQQQVAVKLLRPGIYGAEMITRFARERQILARLQHPDIATLLDGGVADDGRPYLVMQYVKGEPITAYCDRRRLRIEERLELFARVCRAVQFSHANLVVHRDLKPSNILVTEAGELKLLDFGIAKLLDADAASDATRAELRIMTPERAAPEQLLGEPVTAAVDVWGLGVLLCELLSGRVPYRFASRDAGMIVREIESRAPASPGALLKPGTDRQRSPDEPTTQILSELRGCRPERLRRLLAGDLDRIVLMALRREPERRYASAAQLGEDVERYLAGEPVLAHGASRWYRARKFLERHRLGVAAAALFTLLVLGFGVVTALQSRRVAEQRDRANAERDRAEAVVKMLTGLFETADPVKDPGRDQISVTELLERGEQRLEDLAEQPATRASMLLVLGEINAQRTRYARARELLERARDAYQQTAATPDPTSLAIDYQLALTIQAQGHFQEARGLLADSLEAHRRYYGSQHDETADVMTTLAVSSPLDERRALLEEALAVRRALLDPLDPMIASTLNGLGHYYRVTGEWVSARRVFREALDIMMEVEGEKHPHTLAVLSNLGSVLDDPEEHLAIMRRVLELRQEIQPDSAETATAWNNLGVASMYAGRRDDAMRELSVARELLAEHYGDEDWRVGNTLYNIARIHELEGRYPSALDFFDGAIRRVGGARGADHIQTGVLIGHQAQILARLDRLAEATEAAARAVEIVRRAAPEPGQRLAQTLLRQGRVLLAAGSASAAEAVFREALQLPFKDPEDPFRSALSAGLGLALVAQGRRAEARPLLVEAEPVLADWSIADPVALVQLRMVLAELDEGTPSP